MAQSTGTSVITATAADGISSSTCIVTVNSASEAVTLNKTSDMLKVGGFGVLNCILATTH